MAKNNLDEAVKKDDLVIGLKSVVKAINAGLISEVFVSSNGKAFIPKLKLITGSVPIRLLDITSKELGIKCKKPFNITVLGVKGGGKDLKATTKTVKTASKKTVKPAKKVTKKSPKKTASKKGVKGKKK